jgi:inhibitor of cysteine peptidase
MNGKLILVGLVLVGMLAVGGVFFVTRNPAAGAPVTVTEADAGKTIRLHPGDALVVTLDGNPTTGYMWEREPSEDGVLVQVGEPAFQPASDALGASGKVLLHFEAKAKGETTLNLVYHRSWESEAPVKVFAVTVIVD